MSSSSSGWKSANPPVSPQKGRRVRDKIETSPSSRAKCQRCDQKIAKGEERVGIQAKVEVEGLKFQPWQLKYYHAHCVSEGTKRMLFLEDSTAATGNNATVKKEKKAAAKKTARPKAVSNGGHNKLTPKMRRDLERDLREVRRCFAVEQDCEDRVYKIFQNKCLDELVANLPQNQAELLKCWGIGRKRAQQYGSTILATIRPYLASSRAAGTRTPQRAANAVRPSVAAAASSAAARANVVVDDSDDDIVAGPTLSVEELVKKRMEEARARGEEFEILD